MLHGMRRPGRSVRIIGAGPLARPASAFLGRRRGGLLRQVNEASGCARRVPFGLGNSGCNHTLSCRRQPAFNAVQVDQKTSGNPRRGEAAAPSVRIYPLVRSAPPYWNTATTLHIGPRGNLGVKISQYSGLDYPFERSYAISYHSFPPSASH